MGRLKTNKKNYLFLGFIIIAQLIIYLPHVGTGFVKDDFVWLENSLSNRNVDYLKPFVETTGFYRPLVSLSFGLQFDWFEINSRPYGFFNLFLHILNIFLVYLLFFSFKTFKPYALLVTFLFALNVKSSTMAVGWISGRTTLMFAFFSLLSLYLYLKRKQAYFSRGNKIRIIFLYFSVGIIYLAALMSKESAAALPLFVFFINFRDRDDEKKSDVDGLSGLALRVKRLSKALVSTTIYILPLIVYLFLRLKSNAFSPFNTPEYYRYTLSPLVLLKNIWEYLSRSLVFDFFLVICLAFLILILKKKIDINKKVIRKVLIFGILWFLCTILPVLPLMVRSDIYIYLPQLGLHLIFAVFILSLWKKVFSKNKPLKQRYALLIPVLALLMVWLGYFWSRASAYGDEGMSSTQLSRGILKASAGIKKNSRIIIIDISKDNRFSPLNSVAYGFNSLLQLYLPQKEARGEIISPNQLSDLKCNSKFLRFFFFKESLFGGPLRCYELRNLIISLSPQVIEFPKIFEKQSMGIKNRFLIQKKSPRFLGKRRRINQRNKKR